MSLARKVGVLSAIGIGSFAWGVARGWYVNQPGYQVFSPEDILQKGLTYAIVPFASSFTGPFALDRNDLPEGDSDDDEADNNKRLIRYALGGLGISAVAETAGHFVGAGLAQILAK